ncbi:YecA family protein [Marinilactibacillus sp. Marseille-P9653]|uniref:YecA family protein n=1 Tax=Marinilactibacillus sp. Marseille-P9653 TaxID=2866583 RepID=UPI001CE4AE88|nr:SEC-C metal-binding domain-containing protein [Marinilactibacillus sp. Marseille-P9653]
MYVHEEKNYINIAIPTEVMSVINSESYLENKALTQTIASIKNVIKAGVHLYGIVSYQTFVHLYRIEHPELELNHLTLNKLLSYFSTISIGLDFYILDFLRIASRRFENIQHAKLYADTLGFVSYNNQFHPTVKELSFYANNDFDHRLAPYKKLIKIIKNCSYDPGYVMETIEKHALMGSKMSILMDELNEDDSLIIHSEKEGKTIFKFYHDLLGHTRQWKQNGFTVKECSIRRKTLDPVLSKNSLHQEPGVPPVLPLFSDTQETTPRQTVKVGRNEPCPCGSGLKYKKCCGR